MTAKFPRMSSYDILRILHAHGFEDIRQKGSHLILRHPLSHKQTTVPVGKKDLPLGTAKAIFEQSGVMIERQ